MRYSLRTILICTALCCIYAAWVGYLRNMVAIHRLESARIVQELAMQQGVPAREVETIVGNIASKSHGPVDGIRFNAVERLPETVAKLEYLEGQTAKAANHQIISREFEKAVWQPWKVVNARFTP